MNLLGNVLSTLGAFISGNPAAIFGAMVHNINTLKQREIAGTIAEKQALERKKARLRQYAATKQIPFNEKEITYDIPYNPLDDLETAINFMSKWGNKNGTTPKIYIPPKRKYGLGQYSLTDYNPKEKYDYSLQ